MDHSQHRKLKLATLSLLSCTVIGARFVAAQTAIAPVPPAKSVIVGAPALAAPSTPPTVGAATLKLAYAEISPGLLARSVFATKEASPFAVEFVDILVGPKQSVTLEAADFAELLEIEVGAPALSVDGKSVDLPAMRVVGIDQGRRITINNREERAVVARLIQVRKPGK